LANKRGLNLNAIARGTHPDDELSAATVNGLAGDGLAPGESRPQHITREDILAAQRIVSFCDVPSEFVGAAAVEQWKDVPPVSQDYETARDVILEHLHDLLNRLRSSR
jgi:hypothetical protein